MKIGIGLTFSVARSALNKSTFHLPLDRDERHKKDSLRSYQSYTSKQVSKHAEGNFNGWMGALVAKDDGTIPPLSPMALVTLLVMPSEIVSMVDGNVRRITSCCANVLHDILVAVIEHLIRAGPFDEIECFWKMPLSGRRGVHLTLRTGWHSIDRRLTRPPK